MSRDPYTLPGDSHLPSGCTAHETDGPRRRPSRSMPSEFQADESDVGWRLLMDLIDRIAELREQGETHGVFGRDSAPALAALGHRTKEVGAAVVIEL